MISGKRRCVSACTPGLTSCASRMVPPGVICILFAIHCAATHVTIVSHDGALRLGDTLAIAFPPKENSKSSTPLPSWPLPLWSLPFSFWRRYAWHRGITSMSKFSNGTPDDGQRSGVSSSSRPCSLFLGASSSGIAPGCRGSGASGNSCRLIWWPWR